MRVPLPVRARERGRPEIASSKVCRDSRGPWSSGTQRHQPCLSVQRNRQFPAGARAIVERRQFSAHDAFDAALDPIMTTFMESVV